MHSKTAACSELIDHHQAVLHMVSYVLVISNTYLDYKNIKINYKVVAPLFISTTISERPLQPTFTRSTSGHCLGTFTAVNLPIFPRYMIAQRVLPGDFTTKLLYTLQFSYPFFHNT
jgi:hypothetical protein